MRRLHLAVCLSVAVALLGVSQVRACINDRETIRTESEFRKHYEFRSGYRETNLPPELPASEGSWAPTAMTWSGAGLLLAAVGLVVLNVRLHRG